MDYVVRQLFDTNNIALNMGKDNDNNKGISRRDALKRMGLFVAGAAALSMRRKEETYYSLLHCHRKQPLYRPPTGGREYRAAQYSTNGKAEPLRFRGR